jgi:hypothetical protein
LHRPSLHATSMQGKNKYMGVRRLPKLNCRELEKPEPRAVQGHRRTKYCHTVGCWHYSTRNLSYLRSQTKAQVLLKASSCSFTSQFLKDRADSRISTGIYGTSLGTVNLVAPIDRNFIDISAIIRFRLCTFELPIE